MKTKVLWKFAITMAGVIFAAVSFDVSYARIINSINFLGAHALHDSEAEYRLLQLGEAIIEAQRTSTDFSLSIKGAYGESILGNVDASMDRLTQAQETGELLQNRWFHVSDVSLQTMAWLTGKLRDDYAVAFCTVATETSEEPNLHLLHLSLTDIGASADYMLWAFNQISASCNQSESPQEAILSAFSNLSTLASVNLQNALTFITTLQSAMNEPSFRQHGLYGHIFDKLALQAEKPAIFVSDEVYFTGVSRFEIYYEALEQVAREAHTLIPNTHDQIFQTFNMIFTD